MKKAIRIALYFLLTFPPSIQAQSDKPARLFKHGQADAWIGIGLLPTYVKDGARMVLPPVSTGADWMLSDQFSLGVALGYSNYEMKKLPVGEKDMRHYDNQTFQVMGRASAHFTRTDNLDIYGGFQFGVQSVQIKSLDGPFGRIEKLFGIRPQKKRFLYGVCLGLRFAISPKSCLFGEVGTGISFASIGLGVKIG